nr:MAG TPA: hypothetical protein [Caudoviricetes sp.]
MLCEAPNRLTYNELPKIPHDASNKCAPKQTKNAPDDLIAGALTLVVVFTARCPRGLHSASVRVPRG